jgi:hypothetical protein
LKIKVEASGKCKGGGSFHQGRSGTYGPSGR